MIEKFEINAVNYSPIILGVIRYTGILLFLIFLALSNNFFYINPILILASGFILILTTPYLVIMLLSKNKTVIIEENQIVIDKKNNISWTKINSINFSSELGVQYLRIKIDKKTYLLTSLNWSSRSKSFKKLADFLIAFNLNRYRQATIEEQDSSHIRKLNIRPIYQSFLVLFTFLAFLSLAIL